MTLPPRLRIPVPLVRRLPAWLTKADPETRTFLSTGRYPTESAREFATLLCEWADNLVEQWSRDR